MTQTTVERIATLINEGIDGDSAEARAYISTVIDAPGDYPAEVSA